MVGNLASDGGEWWNNVETLKHGGAFARRCFRVFGSGSAVVGSPVQPLRFVRVVAAHEEKVTSQGRREDRAGALLLAMVESYG